eukprot:INCI9105.1.p1 GENE.INCI9105.1~~INCI9105.1.p1  ORF type:complete len:293 (-),score=56.54 INCI9105.1:246-1124(-)
MDYSKWDKWAEDVSDSDEEEDTRGEPVVTRFDGPAKVTFGKGETVAEVGAPTPGRTTAPATSTATPWRQQSITTDSPVEITEVSADGIDQNVVSLPAESASHSASSSASSVKSSTQSSSSSGGAAKSPGYTQNGGVAATHYWSQTKNECVIHLFVPAGTRGRDVTVKLTDTTLTVKVVNKAEPGSPPLTFGGKLAHEVKAPAEADDIDWDIVDEVTPTPRRLLRIALAKKPVAAGVVHWWANVFEGDEKIDVRSIAGRKAGASVSEFQANWAKAHEMFKEKVKGIVKTEVHC